MNCCRCSSGCEAHQASSFICCARTQRSLNVCVLLHGAHGLLGRRAASRSDASGGRALQLSRQSGLLPRLQKLEAGTCVSGAILSCQTFATCRLTALPDAPCHLTSVWQCSVLAFQTLILLLSCEGLETQEISLQPWGRVELYLIDYVERTLVNSQSVLPQELNMELACSMSRCTHDTVAAPRVS